jgi:hypothetical protein
MSIHHHHTSPIRRAVAVTLALAGASIFAGCVVETSASGGTTQPLYIDTGVTAPSTAIDVHYADVFQGVACTPSQLGGIDTFDATIDGTTKDSGAISCVDPSGQETMIQFVSLLPDTDYGITITGYDLDQAACYSVHCTAHTSPDGRPVYVPSTSCTAVTKSC